MSPLPDGLRSAVTTLAARPKVVLATDFDGTLAPLVTDPLAARAADGGLEALRAAAALPGVTVALVSGRDVATLGRLAGALADEPLVLVGSHGAHSSLDEDGDEPLLSPQESTMLAQATAEAEAIVARHPGARIEHKPASVSVHTRGIDPETRRGGPAGGGGRAGPGAGPARHARQAGGGAGRPGHQQGHRAGRPGAGPRRGGDALPR